MKWTFLCKHGLNCCAWQWQSGLFLCTRHVIFPCCSIMFRNLAQLLVSRVSCFHSLQKKQYQCACLGWCHKWLHSILPKRQSAGVANSSFTPDDTILALAAEILCPPITSEIWNWTHECNMQDIHFESLECLSVRVLREFVRRCCVSSRHVASCV